MKRFLLFIAAVLSLVGGVCLPAEAHNADTTTFGTFYRFRTQLNMYFQSNTAWQMIPGLTDRVVDAMVSWNTLQPPDNIHFASLGFLAGMSESACSNGININGMFWGDASAYTGDPNTAAVTFVCRNDGTYPGEPRRAKNTTIVFDGDAPNWSVNPSSAGVPGARDLWSVASHELGHSLGFFMGTTPGSNGVAATHWESPPPGLAQTGQPNGNTLCPPTTARHTMCAVYILGSTMARSPAPHDQHTVLARYP